MALVTNVTSFGRTGLSDFVLQRVTALVLGAYGLCIVGFFAVADVSHASLAAFLVGTAMRWFSTAAVVALGVHAWIGMWTVGTDYIRQHAFGAGLGGSAFGLRLIYQFGCVAAIVVYMAWSVTIIWRLA